MAIRAPRKAATLPDSLNAARAECGWTQEDFWLRYKQVGGLFGLEAFRDWLRGVSTPNVYEYDVIAEVVNTELGEERLPRVPFEFPQPRETWELRGPNGIWVRTRKLGGVPVAA